MKRVFTTLLIMVSSLQFVLAQPTQAEIDKMIKQAQELNKIYGTDSGRNKLKKDLQEQQKQLNDALKNQQNKNNGITKASLYADPSEYGNVDNWEFPVKNTALISSLSQKTFTKPELIKFLNDLYQQLSKKFPDGINTSVQSVAIKNNNDGSKMGNLAIAGWYTNFREESLLLIVKAATIDPDNGLLLNNCAAILNMGGIEQKAVPILKYILRSYPGSAMVLNNLGQAYAGLGETDSAMLYLGRCIKSEPENTEANNTAGQIEAAKGNIEKAIGYFEQSLKGGYNKPAELKLRKIKKNSGIKSFVKPKVKVPEYFNQFKYKFPAQCTSINNASTAEAEYSAFRKTVSDQFQVYMKKLNSLNVSISQLLPPGRKVGKDEFIAQPFHELCGIMARDILEDFSSEIPSDKKYKADLLVLKNEYNNKYDSIRKSYKDREDAASKAGCCGEGNVSCCVPEREKCIALDNLANQYLPKFAMINEDRQEKTMNWIQKDFDELIYWGYLSYYPVRADYFQAFFYEVVGIYLEAMVRVGITEIIKKNCDDDQPFTATSDSLAIKETGCPLDVEIPFVVGKFKMNCDKISFSGGEGAVFSYEKNFKTHQSTVSVGIGIKLELGEKFGPIKGGISAGATETAFITFDGNNGIADAGLKNEVKLTAEGTGVGKKGTAIGSTLGINSGWNFNEGPFKGMIGPVPDVQLNKNIKIFKPNN